MLKAKDFRQQAWDKKKGKWGLLAAITLIYTLIVGACGGATLGIVLLIVAGPLTLGYTVIGLDLMRNKEISIEKLFCGFKHFARAFVLFITNALLIAAWSFYSLSPV